MSAEVDRLLARRTRHIRLTGEINGCFERVSARKRRGSSERDEQK